MSSTIEAVAVDRRRERVVAEMLRSERDFLVADSPAAVAYLTDVDIRPFSGVGTAVILSADGTVTLLVADTDLHSVQDSGFRGTVKAWRSGPGSRAERERLVRDASCKPSSGSLSRGAVEMRSAGSYRHVLSDTRPRSLLTDADSIIEAASRVRDDDELRRLRQAANLADIGYTATVDRLHPELRVLEIVRNVDRSLRSAGGSGWWSPLEDDAGLTVDSSYPHASVAVLLGRRRESGVLDRREPLPFAIYPLSECYAGAAGTTVVLSEPDAGLRSRASLLTDALRAVIDAAKPGATGAELQSAFRSAVGGRVPDDVAAQSVGYGLGTGVSRPFLSAGSRDVLQEGSVVSVRASLPGDGSAPVAYQTTVLITPEGNDVLNVVPLRMIELY
ncbi:M24 family metallopeptidase [Leifsonia shinshuensis]|uniref:Aminopeptidase P family protein n=1 Tax=Leifsonia shinshuensis TaxID=150026 RepID=A0A7G6YE45_9MICO|nr:M24 family metallopeptidase [Leifsonia shinshuensis]QNE36760.1 aminopeptidase P family protein [Leifsonia shinshuensis]